ncbi:MAG: hypothetical protein RL391_1579 [Actinomycetota bacterium]
MSSSSDHKSGSDAPRPLKEEQRSATEQIDELAPGVLRTQLPIDIPGLGHVNMYVLEDERGVAVVDPGLPNKSSYAQIAKHLRTIGVPISRVHTVIVTHSHPDHFGGAHWIQSQSGADIVTHESFRVIWDPTEPPDVDVETAADLPPARKPWEPTPWGGPGMQIPWKRKARYKLMSRLPKLMRLPRPTVRLADAERYSFARREWVAVHTPGHTADHLCLFDPETGLMLCGDHVLPTITPHISGLIRARDPLNLFFESLDKVAAFGNEVKLALPAHGNPFTDLAGRAMEIKEHHYGRLQRLRDAADDLGRPATVMEMSQYLFSPRAQGGMADSETFAHLEHLRHAGEFTRTETDGEYLYVPVD